MLIYKFHSISFSFIKSNKALEMYLNEYTNLELVDKPTECNIDVYFNECKDVSIIVDSIDNNANLIYENKQVDENKYHYRIYSHNNAKWILMDGVGGTYINFENNTMNIVLVNELDTNDILQFLLFCSNPMIRFIKHYGYTSLHAACINIKNKNILVTGLSGRGKSTATFALLQHGHKAITDESTLIKKSTNGFKGYSMTNWLKVEKGAKESFFSDITDEYIMCEDAYIIKLSDINKCAYHTAETIDYIFILEQTGGTETNIINVNPLEVIGELFPVTLSLATVEYTNRAFTVISELLDEIECCKVLFGTDMNDFNNKVESFILDKGK